MPGVGDSVPFYPKLVKLTSATAFMMHALTHWFVVQESVVATRVENGLPDVTV